MNAIYLPNSPILHKSPQYTYVQQPFQKIQPLKVSNIQKVTIIPQTARSKSPNSHRYYDHSSFSRIKTSSPFNSTTRSPSSEWRTVISKLSKDFSSLKGYLMDKDED